MNWLQRLFEAQLAVGGSSILWREVVGNGFGLASAVGGMRRQVWAWPVGIVGNVLLFTVFFAVAFTDQSTQTPLLGQAGRQVFFIATSVYGWWSWRRARAGRESDAPAITPRWPSRRERAAYVGLWLVGVVIAQWVFAHLGQTWPAPRWWYWADAWIFVGSFIATFAMARGWIDFWLAWIAVDLVGIPLLVHARYYPSAMLYGVYAAFVLWGFAVWLRAREVDPPTGGLPAATDPVTERKNLAP